MDISTVIEKNIKKLENNIFNDCFDLKKRQFVIGEEKTVVYMAFLEQAADHNAISLNVVQNLVVWFKERKENSNYSEFDFIKDGNIARIDIAQMKTIEEATQAILRGDTILLIDGYNIGMVIASTNWPGRGVQQAETEVIVLGAKEAFTESVRTNIALIRHIIRNADMKVKSYKIGKLSNTTAEIVYIDGVVRPSVLEKIEAQIKNLKIDGIVESGALEQFIERDSKSFFPQMQLTERPDRTASALMQGRVAVVMDNTPFVMLLPTTINTFFHSMDDYCDRWQISSFVRTLRYIAAFIALALPGFYLAITLYHPSMLPTSIILKMAGARQQVPFPGLIEVILMELAFEFLREAGIRLPQSIGSTIGIVGGIVIGQAVVDASIVSPMVVIIVSITAIASFTLPDVMLVSAFRLLKYLIIVMSSFLGLYGFWLAILLVVSHLVALKSYEIPYLYPLVSPSVNDYEDLKDSLIRLPMPLLKRRSIFANKKSEKEK